MVCIFNPEAILPPEKLRIVVPLPVARVFQSFTNWSGLRAMVLLLARGQKPLLQAETPYIIGDHCDLLSLSSHIGCWRPLYWLRSSELSVYYLDLFCFYWF